MIETILDKSHSGTTWLDVVNPSHEELHGLAFTWGLHPKTVEDCLEPEHLPKYENVGGKSFALFRLFDDGARVESNTVQSITRKLAIFFGPDFVITVHRSKLAGLNGVKEKWHATSQKKVLAQAVLADCINIVAVSFDAPLEKAENLIDKIENNVFSNRTVAGQIKKVHFLRRRVSIFRRMLWHGLNVCKQIPAQSAEEAPLLQDVRENLDEYYHYSDTLLEDMNALLSIQLSLDANKTNTIMRILTVFSMFFMPLTFIVGIYGMNFRRMPELEWAWGYPATLVLMAAITVMIFFWFKRRGYLR